MNKFSPTWRSLSAPTLSSIVCIDEYAVNHSITTTYRTHYPAFFLTRKANAIEFYIGALKFTRQESPGRFPLIAVVVGDENDVARQQKAGFFIAKIYVVNRVVGADVLANPRLTTIVRAT